MCVSACLCFDCKSFFSPSSFASAAAAGGFTFSVLFLSLFLSNVWASACAHSWYFLGTPNEEKSSTGGKRGFFCCDFCRLELQLFLLLLKKKVDTGWPMVVETVSSF